METKTLSTLTHNIASKIFSGSFFDFENFIKNADCNDYIKLSHFNFFYSYPEFGMKWKNGKNCQFHQVNTKCHLCGAMPERNYAGVGTINVLHNGVSDKEILVNDGFEIKRGVKIYKSKRVKNTPRLSQMILLCNNHVDGYFMFNNRKINTVGQIALF